MESRIKWKGRTRNVINPFSNEDIKMEKLFPLLNNIFTTFVGYRLLDIWQPTYCLPTFRFLTLEPNLQSFYLK